MSAATAALTDRYGTSRAEAGNRCELELARLLIRSGWTQEDLATRLGKNPGWVSRRLLFGRYLTFLPNGKTAENSLWRGCSVFHGHASRASSPRRSRSLPARPFDLLACSAPLRCFGSRFRPITTSLRPRGEDLSRTRPDLAFVQASLARMNLPPPNPNAVGKHLTDLEFAGLRLWLDQQSNVVGRAWIYGSRQSGIR